MSVTKLKEEFLKDKVWTFIFENIKKGHQVPHHTIDTLLQNKDEKDYCCETTHFMIITLDNDSVYVSYDTYTWLRELGEDSYSFPTNIYSITWFDNQFEFNMETARKLYSDKQVDIDKSLLN